MFKPGDSVYIMDSAQADIGALAWNYVTNHRTATIVEMYSECKKNPSENLYVVVWSEQFDGATSCWNHCLPQYGQMIAQKHMELNFEASREVVTVPNIEFPPDRTRS